MTKLRITPDGRIRGLWDDAIPLADLGSVRVRRASHVEYDNRRQCWTVRPAGGCRPRAGWIGRLFGRLTAPAVHHAGTRADALNWEKVHFEPGGRYWRP